MDVLQPEETTEVNREKNLEPETLAKGEKKQTQLFISEEIRKKAKLIGNGNMTKGFIKAVEKYDC